MNRSQETQSQRSAGAECWGSRAALRRQHRLAAGAGCGRQESTPVLQKAAASAANWLKRGSKLPELSRICLGASLKAIRMIPFLPFSPAGRWAPGGVIQCDQLRNAEQTGAKRQRKEPRPLASRDAAPRTALRLRALKRFLWRAKSPAFSGKVRGGRRRPEQCFTPKL